MSAPTLNSYIRELLALLDERGMDAVEICIEYPARIRVIPRDRRGGVIVLETEDGATSMEGLIKRLEVRG